MSYPYPKEQRDFAEKLITDMLKRNMTAGVIKKNLEEKLMEKFQATMNSHTVRHMIWKYRKRIKEGVNVKYSCAMNIATIAISQLSRIPLDDPLRIEGYQAVSKWIEQHSRET